jgi:hypothetical protein
MQDPERKQKIIFYFFLIFIVLAILGLLIAAIVVEPPSRPLQNQIVIPTRPKMTHPINKLLTDLKAKKTNQPTTKQSP